MVNGFFIAEAKKFADELTAQIALLRVNKAAADKKLYTAEIAIERFASYKPRREDGGYRCPKCWICEGVDQVFGPIGERENGKKIYKCKCGYRVSDPY